MKLRGMQKTEAHPSPICYHQSIPGSTVMVRSHETSEMKPARSPCSHHGGLCLYDEVLFRLEVIEDCPRTVTMFVVCILYPITPSHLLHFKQLAESHPPILGIGVQRIIVQDIDVGINNLMVFAPKRNMSRIQRVGSKIK